MNRMRIDVFAPQNTFHLAAIPVSHSIDCNLIEFKGLNGSLHN